MYSKELYEKYKEVRKRAARKYYQSHREKYLLYYKEYYKRNKEKLYKKNRQYKAKDAKWREYEKECSKLCHMFLYPEEIPEQEFYGCVSDLNLKIEKEGFIYGTKC